MVAPERFGAGDALGPGLDLSLHDGINGQGLAAGVLRTYGWFLNFKGGYRRWFFNFVLRATGHGGEPRRAPTCRGQPVVNHGPGIAFSG